ncbi:MAG: hypothetical protein HZC38_08260 [Chloroflexi bacterium]|nr:hypothetical protein [Chloroflexota bacterium]
MAGRDGQGKSFSPGSRKRDTTVDDALKTMERLSLWLENANEENAWLQTEDPVQMAMLHGMLVHLREEIDRLIALGGDELDETVKALHTLATQDKEA